MTAVPRSRRMTVEEAYLAKVRAIGSPEERPATTGDSAEEPDQRPPERPATPLIVESGPGAVGAEVVRPETVISGRAPSETSAEEPGSGGPESLGDTPRPVFGLPGPGAAVRAVHSPEPLITAVDGPGVAAPPSAPSPVISSSGHTTAPAAAARPRTPITGPSRRPEVRPPARPRIEPEPAILGLSRHTRSRLGSRLFNLFFVLVFALIVIQMVMALLTP